MLKENNSIFNINHSLLSISYIKINKRNLLHSLEFKNEIKSLSIFKIF